MISIHPATLVVATIGLAVQNAEHKSRVVPL